MKQHYFASVRRALYGESLAVAREIFEQRKQEMTMKQIAEAVDILEFREREERDEK